MRRIQPVSISKVGFDFCRYGVAILIWSSALTDYLFGLVLSACILGLSALLKVRRAPLVVLGEKMLGQHFRETVIVDENAMRFAHSMGFVLNMIVLMLAFRYGAYAKGIIVSLALLKTISAAGHCSALKLYDCLNNDNCCKGVKKYSHKR